jgi:hypothetical protein
MCRTDDITNAQTLRRDLGVAGQWKDDPGSPIGAGPQLASHRQRRHLGSIVRVERDWEHRVAAHIESGERCDPSARSDSSNGAVLASFWRLPGMPSDSGTPTDWLDAPSHQVVNVHCACELDVAASRFLQRRRHFGHLDRESSAIEVFASLRKLTQFPPLDIGQRIDVDTSKEPNLVDVARAIRGVLELQT